MNLYHVQTCASWKNASKACRSEFIETMRDLEYSAQATLDAWEWFYLGWEANVGEIPPERGKRK